MSIHIALWQTAPPIIVFEINQKRNLIKILLKERKGL